MRTPARSLPARVHATPRPAPPPRLARVQRIRSTIAMLDRFGERYAFSAHGDELEYSDAPANPIEALLSALQQSSAPVDVTQRCDPLAKS
jgi:hypothetical protein